MLQLPSVRVWHETYLASVVFGKGRDEEQYGAFGPARACSSFEAVRDRLGGWGGERGERGEWFENQEGGDTDGNCSSSQTLPPELDRDHSGLLNVSGRTGVNSNHPERPRTVSGVKDHFWDQMAAAMRVGSGAFLSSSSSRCCDDLTHQAPPENDGFNRRHLFVKCSPLYQMEQILSNTLPRRCPGAAQEPKVDNSSSKYAVAPNFTHTFLIRRPDKVALSMMKLANDAYGGNPSDSHSSIHSDTANALALLEQDLVQTHRMYRFVQQQQLEQQQEGSCIVVIDSDDLLVSPESVLRGYCGAVGLPYSPSMLRWPVGPVTEWLPRGAGSAEWEKGPFASVFRSNGFIRPGEAVSRTTSQLRQQPSVGLQHKDVPVEENLRMLPPAMADVVERHWGLYQELYDARSQFNG